MATKIKRKSYQWHKLKIGDYRMVKEFSGVAAAYQYVWRTRVKKANAPYAINKDVPTFTTKKVPSGWRVERVK